MSSIYNESSNDHNSRGRFWISLSEPWYNRPRHLKSLPYPYIQGDFGCIRSILFILAIEE